MELANIRFILNIEEFSRTAKGSRGELAINDLEESEATFLIARILGSNYSGFSPSFLSRIVRT